MGSSLPEPELGSNPDAEEVLPDFETPANADSTAPAAEVDDDAEPTDATTEDVNEDVNEASGLTDPDPEVGSDLPDADPAAE